MREKVIIIILNLFFVILMAFVPVGIQFKSGINNGAFRIKKIKRFAFMFRAPNGISVSKEGLAIPLFVIQVLGYVLALLVLIANIVLVFVDNTLKIGTIVTLSVLAVEMISLVVACIVLSKISNR